MYHGSYQNPVKKNPERHATDVSLSLHTNLAKEFCCVSVSENIAEHLRCAKVLEIENHGVLFSSNLFTHECFLKIMPKS